MTTALDTLDPRHMTAAEAARFMGRYAKDFSAGAFAIPTVKEIERAMSTGDWRTWPGVVAMTKQLTRDSTRLDFTGRRYTLRQNARIITHIAAQPDANLPRLSFADWVYAYVEDANLTRQLRAQGREVHAVRVSASSEIIACWGLPGSGWTVPSVDAATLVQVPVEIPDLLREAVLVEVGALDAWHDDFPFYSDGSWGALNLRGFNPADPQWGIKPAEMSKSWWAEHPEAKQYDRCQWTVLAERCPFTVDLVRDIFGDAELERVRLLRMAGRDGRGGSLSRHTDITDRAAGTDDGQIVRFHVPLITAPEITMTGWNLRGVRTDVHLPAWTMWYLDARKPHAVDNRAGIDRIHLVIDVVADKAARQMITEGKDHAA